MKRNIYTLAHDVDLLREIDNNGGRFTAEEHAYAVKKEHGETVFRTRENLLCDYLSRNPLKLGALGFLIDFIKKKNEHLNILSLGAGPCVLEYLLKMALPDELKVIACDFDAYFCRKARQYFPEIVVERFDFFKDDIRDLQSRLNVKFDLVVFFGSAYVMDDTEFIKLFNDLKNIKVKQVMDFHAGYMDLRDVIMNYLEPIRMNSTLRNIFHKKPVSVGGYRGKFHGYSRDRCELRKLYKKSGLALQDEISVPGYKYVAVLG